MGKHVRDSPLLVSGRGRDPCRQHGKEEEMLGICDSYRNGQEKKERNPGLIQCCAIAL